MAVVTREAVLEALRAYGTWATIPEVADRLGGDRRAVARVVGQLMAAGVVARAQFRDGDWTRSPLYRAV